MAANRKFTPRASSNLIDGEVTDAVEIPVEETVDTAEVETEEVVDETAPAEDTTVESTENDSEEKKEEKTDEVTFTAETGKAPIERMVKIRLAKKYDGCIGGTWYHFVKDQVVNVPENVKRILNSAEGMLKPL